MEQRLVQTPIAAGQQSKSFSASVDQQRLDCYKSQHQIKFSLASSSLVSGCSTRDGNYWENFEVWSLIRCPYRHLFLETSRLRIASSYFFPSYLGSTISPRCMFSAMISSYHEGLIACACKHQWMDRIVREKASRLDQ